MKLFDDYDKDVLRIRFGFGGDGGGDGGGGMAAGAMAAGAMVAEEMVEATTVMTVASKPRQRSELPTPPYPP
jgi:hypothetical protein